MKPREKITQEINRRLNEVDWFQRQELQTQELAQTFFSRIADYVNYIKTTRELNKFAQLLENKRKSLDIDNVLKKEGDEIIEKLRTDFELIKRILKKRKVTVMPYEKAFPPGFSGSLSENQVLSLEYFQIDNFLKADTQYVADIPRNISHFWSLLGIVNRRGIQEKKLGEISESYIKVKQDYEEKLRFQQVQISFLRFDDYESLLEVWKYYYEVPDFYNVSILRFKLGKILDEKGTIFSLNQEQKSQLEQYRQEYLLHIHRYHNYLLDELEKKNFWIDAVYWLWNNFGRTLISMIIIFIILYICKYLGFTQPLESIKSLLQ